MEVLSSILFIFFSYLNLFPNHTSAQLNGRVPAGTTLTAGQKSRPWISPSGDFAFGFKQLQENKDQFMFSIWFNKIPDQTVAWYPNSINPVVPRGSSIRVDFKSGMVLLDPQNRELWRSAPQGFHIQTSEGFMNDTGNFILKGKDGSWLWESFKVYSDTILPGQELGIGSALNSRNGRFNLRLLAEGNLVLKSKVLAQNSDEGVQYYSSMTSDHNDQSNSGFRAVFDGKGSIYVTRKNNKSTQLSPVSVSVSDDYLRATLEFDGVFILYSHPRSFTAGTNPAWNIIWSVPDNICIDLLVPDESGVCGYNNICRLENGRPVCFCPRGFTFVDPNNRYGNCKPNFTPTCDGKQESDIVMLEETDVDWPLSDYHHINPATKMLCNQTCFEDCFCVVSIFRANQCWKKKFPLSNGRRDTSLGATAFIKSRSGYGTHKSMLLD